MSASDRALFVHPDPDAVGTWCREHATEGSVLVAPSAAARRHAIQRVVDARGITLGLTVTSPARLLPLLELRAGLAPPPMLSATLERLLVARAARDAGVPLFEDDGHETPVGAVHAVSALIRSLRLNGITPGQYREAGGRAQAADAYARFEQYRHSFGCEDQAGRIARLIATGVPSVALVLEDPAIPNAAAHDLLAAATGAALSCHIGVADLTPAGGASPTIARLEALGFRATRAGVRGLAPRMRAVGGVGMHDEVELVARQMLRLLRDGAPAGDGADRTVRAADILGVAPNDGYLALLGDACGRLGIPIASPRRLDVLEVPLVRALLDAFRLLAAPDEDTVEHGLALLATPYVGLTLHQQDRLARELITRGLGELRSWRRHADSAGRKSFRVFTESVEGLARQLTGPRTPRELAGVVAALGLDHGFVSAGRRAGLSSGRDESVRLDQQGWEALTTALDELDDALRASGVERLPALHWLAELTEVLRGMEVRVDARGADGVHLTVAGAGLPAAMHVFAVGWREGLVPRRVRDDPLLPDRVKQKLNERGAMFPLAPDRGAVEYERRERVCRAARESLTISWPSTGEDGEQLLPSFYLDDLGVTDRTVRSVGDTTWPIPLAASRGERVARATYLARHRAADALGDELALVRSTLAAMSPAEHHAYDGALHSGQTIQLPADVLDEIAPLAGTMSASQARMVVHCLYEHFGKKRLKLESLVAPRLDMLRIGKIAHGVLADLGRAGFEPGAFDATIERWWSEQVPDALTDDPAVHFQRELLVAQLRPLVEGESAHLRESGSRAAHFELGVGLQSEGLDPASRQEGLVVALPAESPLRESTLRGSIDRVDVVERDGRRYGVAIDYKLGKGESYGKEMQELADFQLPIYCGLLPEFDIEPVGAFYLGIGSNERHGVVRADFADVFVPEGNRGVKRLAADEFQAFMGERQAALREQIARIARGELVTSPRKDDCKYCDLRPVCRIGTFGIGGKHDDE